MTLNMPKLGLTSFLSLSRTQKTVGPKILEIWDTLFNILLPDKSIYQQKSYRKILIVYGLTSGCRQKPPPEIETFTVKIDTKS